MRLPAVTVAAIALLAFTPHPAQADPVWAKPSLDGAVAHWHIACDVSLHWVPMVPKIMGRADPETCSIDLNDQWVTAIYASPPFACAVIWHEAGHLAGQAHSPYPWDVMYSELATSMVPTECWELGRRLQRVARLARTTRHGAL